jgi:hypothetical protein
MLDVSDFALINVADTCAVWNVLSAHVLCHLAHAQGCHVVITKYVEYECLHKPRKKRTKSDDELRRRLVRSRDEGRFGSQPLTVDDLQDVTLLQQRRSLGLGELASIAYAKKIGQSALTDDQRARRLAREVGAREQTTPHLLGWLTFHGHVTEAVRDEIIRCHEEMERPLRRFFAEMFAEGMRCRALAQGQPTKA